MKYCIHQVFRPLEHYAIPGYGNCLICKLDELNKNCKGYCPIEINLKKLEEKDKEK